MRKTYHKPKLWYEDFRLSQSIASGCEGIANYAENLCSVTVKIPGPGTDPATSIEVFMSSSVCLYFPPNLDDTVCYHAPNESNNVYSS